MNLSAFDYALPEDLIAQQPLAERDAARLLTWRQSVTEHRSFRDLPALLDPEDVLVLNDSRVIPCRLYGRKAGTGGRVEVFLLRRLDPLRWESLLQPLKKIRPEQTILLSKDLTCVLEKEKNFGSANIVRFNRPLDYPELERIGRIPLPPYINRPVETGEEKEQKEKDRTFYQTVYARDYGSVAAPTAGLHFTEDLLGQIRQKGVRIARVTLEVSWGTFKPVQCERIEEHVMHEERYALDEENAGIIRSCTGRRVLVGTTSCRVLETLMEKYGEIRPERGVTGIFLYPGRTFRATDCLITNFHLPKSTLLMLVAGFIGREETLRIYRTAVAERYRFFSYGDAMFLDPGLRKGQG